MPRTPRLPLRLLAAAGMLLLAACSSDGDDDAAAVTQPAELGVFVIVVDSLMPQEIGAAATPTPVLAGFRTESTHYGESRAVFSAETIPNHVAMMTGVYPERSGIPTNSYWNRQGDPAARDLSLPSELDADTLFTRIKRECPNIRTAAVLSKDYLYEIFSDCGFSGEDCGRNRAPDYHFDPTADPSFLPSPFGLTPDLTTMNMALAALPDADFMFINLGEVDRIGHADVSGITGIPLLRNTALTTTDLQIGRFLQALRDAGRWDNSVVIILSDHGMDWSLPVNAVNTTPALQGIGGFFAVQSGGTDSIYLTEPANPLRNTWLMLARSALLATPGIADAWYTQSNPLDPGVEKLVPASLRARHPNLGDLVASAADGYRFSEPSLLSNPIPGNHGHAVTFHNSFMIGGGAAFLRHQAITESDSPLDPFERRAQQSENVDVAPTVAWLFGLDGSGFQGRVLREAFDLPRAPTRCGVYR